MAQIADFQIDDTRMIKYLKHEIMFKNIQHKVLCQHIIVATAEEQGITVLPEEIQQAANQFRYQNKLETAAQTFNWLKKQSISQGDWEQGIRNQILSKKLSKHLFGKQVVSHFAQNKADYEQVILYKISVPYRVLAQELLYKIEEEEITFYEAAHLYDIEERRRLACGFEGKLSRWQLNPDLSSKIFGSRDGEIVGVIDSSNSYDLYLAEEFISANLSPEVETKILEMYFSNWLNTELNYCISSKSH